MQKSLLAELPEPEFFIEPAPFDRPFTVVLSVLGTKFAKATVCLRA